jgi:hypothetical protein
VVDEHNRLADVIENLEEQANDISKFTGVMGRITDIKGALDALKGSLEGLYDRYSLLEEKIIPAADNLNNNFASLIESNDSSNSRYEKSIELYSLRIEKEVSALKEELRVFGDTLSIEMSNQSKETQTHLAEIKGEMLIAVENSNENKEILKELIRVMNERTRKYTVAYIISITLSLLVIGLLVI